MDLPLLQRHWDELGRTDPFGSILIDPELEGPWRSEDFFKRGEEEIADLIEFGETLGLPEARRAALDFGCGVGRLTQALATRFEHVVGVDIAPSMIELAERYNRYGDRCSYVLNEQPSLERFAAGSFDLVYSNVTLQHMVQPLAEGYIAELVRVLRPGGLLVFQVTSGPARVDPLPPEAHRARIELVDPPAELPAGASTHLHVRVRNESPHLWPSHKGGYPIMVGNHWRDRFGRRMVALDDGRSLLPADVAPGEEADVELAVTAPAIPGRYVLEVDLVQQEISWFARPRDRPVRRGSRTARKTVKVGAEAAPAEPPPPAEEPFVPRYEMHYVPKERVLELLSSAGARVIEVVENDSAGIGWISFRYTATL